MLPWTRLYDFHSIDKVLGKIACEAEDLLLRQQ
jgi:hypothetical protein